MCARPVRVVPGLRCDGNQLAELVRLYSGDNALADRIRAAGITAWTLCQAVPFVADDARQLLAAHKPLLCTVAGLPHRPHLTPAPPAAAAETTPPPLPTALRPAKCLRGKRLRISLQSAKPQFCRTADGRVQCNRCDGPVAAATDAQLADAVHRGTWHELHWKTFMCAPCHAQVRPIDAARTAVCRSCYGAHAAPLHWTPLHFARADDATQPRMLALCATCMERAPIRGQLATVRLRDEIIRTATENGRK